MCTSPTSSSAAPPNNRKPESKEVLNCNPFLKEEIEAVNPRIIVPMGAIPARWFLGSSYRMIEVIGKEHEWDGRVLFPVYHPAYAGIYNTDAIPEYLAKFRHLADLVNDTWAELQNVKVES